MSKKLMSHDLERMLLEQPTQVVMVNGDHNACETEELTEDTVNLEQKKTVITLVASPTLTFG